MRVSACECVGALIRECEGGEATAARVTGWGALRVRRGECVCMCVYVLHGNN